MKASEFGREVCVRAAELMTHWRDGIVRGFWAALDWAGL